jgi:hypothetical protein
VKHGVGTVICIVSIFMATPSFTLGVGFRSVAHLLHNFQTEANRQDNPEWLTKETSIYLSTESVCTYAIENPSAQMMPSYHKP